MTAVTLCNLRGLLAQFLRSGCAISDGVFNHHHNQKSFCSFVVPPLNNQMYPVEYLALTHMIGSAEKSMIQSINRLILLLR